MTHDATIKILCKAVFDEKLDYNAYRPAGSEDGFVFFRVLKREYVGKKLKLGLPVYIAIDDSGDYKIVSDYDAGKRAIKREFDLMSKSPTGDTIQNLPIQK
jgi:hypothetical protein